MAVPSAKTTPTGRGQPIETPQRQHARPVSSAISSALCWRSTAKMSGGGSASASTQSLSPWTASSTPAACAAASTAGALKARPSTAAELTHRPRSVGSVGSVGLLHPLLYYLHYSYH